MKNILLTIFLFIFFTKLNAGQFSMSAYVYYTVDKIFTLSEDTQVWFWNNKGIQNYLWKIFVSIFQINDLFFC